MGAVIAVLTGLAMLIFWLGRAAQGARHIGDAAQEISDLPRKMRFKKKSGRSGLALITDSREAACVLMIGVARSSGAGTVTEAESKIIADLLVSNMGWPQADAPDFVDSLRWLTRDINQPGSVLRPMTKFLTGKVNGNEAEDLAHMLTEVAITGSAATDKQTHFIYQYRQMMGLNVDV